VFEFIAAPECNPGCRQDAGQVPRQSSLQSVRTHWRCGILAQQGDRQRCR